MPISGSGNAFSGVIFSTESPACSFLQTRTSNNTRFVALSLAVATADEHLVPPNEPGTYEVSVNRTVRTVKAEAGKQVVLTTGTLVVEL